MKANLERLQRNLKYQFKDLTYLTHALTHRSMGAQNNERLEFLGDAILGFEIADVLVENHINATEGQLSRMRSSLVKRETLAEIAHNLELGDYLILGEGELRSGGHRRDSILADSVEAVIAAIYKDGSLDDARAFIRYVLDKRISNTSPSSESKDPKTLLQEYLQAKRLAVPVYEVVAIKGEQHDQNFIVDCSIPSMSLKTRGEGKSRRKSEQESAELMLTKLKKNNG